MGETLKFVYIVILFVSLCLVVADGVKNINSYHAYSHFVAYLIHKL